MTMGGVPEEMLLPSLPHFAAGNFASVGDSLSGPWLRPLVEEHYLGAEEQSAFPMQSKQYKLHSLLLESPWNWQGTKKLAFRSGLSHGGGPLLSIATTSSASGGVFPAHEATKQRTPESQTKRPKKAHSNEEASWSPMATGEMRKAALVDVERGGAGKRKLLQNTEKSY
ncbi:hypothetical protein BHE74_00055097 [Ensete ventricosum]|nr:hypothetical protein BHE74_00055097 [Ensete ventricosum]